MAKKKTTKRLGKKVNTEDLYEQCYASDYSNIKTNTGMLSKWAEMIADEYRKEHLKTDRQILEELQLTTKSIECTCDIIFFTSVLSLVIVFVSLVFTLLIFINH